ncbi:MAG: SSI family serine proteinase inhibitor, partial [Propionibacteriaceae bacterium]
MRTRLMVLGLLFPAIASLAACGGTTPADPAATSAPSASPAPTASPSNASESTLTVVYDDGNGKTSTWQLSCDPAGGDHPDPAAACAALTKSAATALPAVSKDKMCTQQFGGPQTATLTGTW